MCGKKTKVITVHTEVDKFHTPPPPDFVNDRYDTLNAWRLWEIESCIERNRQHYWICEIMYDETSVSLTCENCPADLNDLLVDGVDLVYGTFKEVEISNGIHNSAVDLKIPVYLSIDATRYGYLGNYEYDVFVNLTERA